MTSLSPDPLARVSSESRRLRTIAAIGRHVPPKPANRQKIGMKGLETQM
jgi:hypothetical protein